MLVVMGPYRKQPGNKPGDRLGMDIEDIVVDFDIDSVLASVGIAQTGFDRDVCKV